jgi:hypothetical protein
MAEWKKVVVSGSNISQLNNDAGYLVAAGLPNTFATMSINGVSVIADSTTDILTFASASGAGLNIVGDAGADSITFTLGNIPNTSLANSTISGKALGTNLDSLTAGTGLSGTAYNGSAAQTFSVAYGSTSGTAVQGNTTISITGTSNEVEITGTTAQALGGGPAYTIGLPNDVTIGNNLTVTGDLYVNGTTTTINTADLYVEDKFIVLASGSATSMDGGIIIDRNAWSYGGNTAFGYDSDTDRWGYQSSIALDSTNAITIGTDGQSAFAAYVFTEAAHTSTKPTMGEFVTAGSIYTNTDGTIWMYA